MSETEERKGWLLCALASVVLLLTLWVGSYIYMQYTRTTIMRAWIKTSDGNMRDIPLEYVRYDKTRWTERGLYCVHYPLAMIRNRFCPSAGHESYLE